MGKSNEKVACLGAKSLLTAVALVVGLDQPEGAVHPGTNQLLVVLKQLQLLEHVAALGTAPANLRTEMVDCFIQIKRQIKPNHTSKSTVLAMRKSGKAVGIKLE